MWPSIHHQLLRLTYTLDTIDKAAQDFWQARGTNRVIAFSGEMGQGKTTFIHHLCTQLAVEDTVSSPTFALINEYHFPEAGKDTIIYHLDWYRLKSTEEAIQAGMEDCILQANAGGAYCFIEWPERAKELLQPPYLRVSIQSPDANTREMTVEEVLA